MDTLETLNLLVSTGALLLFLASAVLLFDLFSGKSLAPYVRKWGLSLAFGLSTVGMLISLYYSEVLGIVPCGLCWFGRIFLYPQAFITGTALWLKDHRIAIYGIVLSVPGLLISLYHHLIQMGGSTFIACPTAGAGADCAKRIIFEFGFMTFPLIGAATFTFLIVLYWYLYKTS